MRVMASHRISSGLRYPCSRPMARSIVCEKGCRTAFRKTLQFIVMTVMGVISGTFLDAYGVFYMTVN